MNRSVVAVLVSCALGAAVALSACDDGSDHGGSATDAGGAETTLDASTDGMGSNADATLDGSTGDGDAGTDGGADADATLQGASDDAPTDSDARSSPDANDASETSDDRDAMDASEASDGSADATDGRTDGGSDAGDAANAADGGSDAGDAANAADDAPGADAADGHVLTTAVVIQMTQSPDCYSCALTSGCLDPGAGYLCEELDASAQAGPAAGTPRSDLCLAALQCISGTMCPNASATDLTPCFCGTAASTPCQSGATAPNGACVTQEQNGLETLDAGVIFGQLSLGQAAPSVLGADVANRVAACLINTCFACFP